MYVPAPEGKFCCKKTAAEIAPVVSGASACSRHKQLPTGPLSPLQEKIQMLILNELMKGHICNDIGLTFALLWKHHLPHGSQQHVKMPVVQFHSAAQSVPNKYLQRSQPVSICLSAKSLPLAEWHHDLTECDVQSQRFHCLSRADRYLLTPVRQSKGRTSATVGVVKDFPFVLINNNNIK